MNGPGDLQVPTADASWPEIWNFALSYNAYDRQGGFNGAARIGNASAERWRHDQSLPNDLPVARAALFFEQRRYRHFDSYPSGGSEMYIRALLERIRDLSGGHVEGPADSLP